MNKQFVARVEKFYFKNQKLITLLFVAVVTVIVILDQTIFDGKLKKVSLYINLAAALIVFTFMAIVAGYAVIQSLFLLGAELTLLIFLAQSYCSVPARTENGDMALEVLIVFGMFFVLLKFGESLYKRLTGFSESLPKNDKVWSIIILLLFLLTVAIFLFALYQVVSPIFTSLCIYEQAT